MDMWNKQWETESISNKIYKRKTELGKGYNQGNNIWGLFIIKFINFQDKI